MYRATIALMCVIAALITACASGQHDAQDNQSPARWPLHVPHGWHVVRFSYSRGGVHSTGVQLSNVRLPPPAILPGKGTTVEISGAVLPPAGVGLVITPNDNHGLPQEKATMPPLPLPWPDGSRGWLLGSSPGRGPVFEWLKFRVNGTTYVAVVTIGSKATRAAQHALVPIVRSIT